MRKCRHCNQQHDNNNNVTSHLSVCLIVLKLIQIRKSSTLCRNIEFADNERRRTIASCFTQTNANDDDDNNDIDTAQTRSARTVSATRIDSGRSNSSRQII